jgi:hypothetical protein
MTETLTKIVVDCTTGQQSIIPLTAEEIAQRAEAEAARVAAEEAKTNLKNSAKAKLIAGEPLTAEEAEVLVI